jgi:hypothetical protein
MKKRILLIVGVVMILFGVIGVTAVNALTISDPWTVKAATFNPKGIRYAGGITSGNELLAGSTHTWTEPMRVAMLAEISKQK